MAAKRSRSRFVLPELGEKAGRRPARVADNIKSEIASLLQRKIKDPRVYNLTVTDVKITADLRRAQVFFSCLDNDIEKAEAGLKSAKGFIRSHLAREMGMRYVPEIEFRHDKSIEQVANMDKLFQEIAEENGHPSE